MKLNKIPLYQEFKIIDFTNYDFMQQRLQDLGFIKGATIRKVLSSYISHIDAYRIHGTTIALRKEDAEKIIVDKVGKEYDEAFEKRE